MTGPLEPRPIILGIAAACAAMSLLLVGKLARAVLHHAGHPLAVILIGYAGAVALTWATMSLVLRMLRIGR